MRYVIDGKLAYLNDHDASNRGNKFMGAKLKKEMTEMVAWQLAGKPKITQPCYIAFNWRYASKHDFDNIRFAAKYVLDGMVKAGVLENDSQKFVLGFKGDTFTRVPPEEVGVDVTVTFGE